MIQVKTNTNPFYCRYCGAQYAKWQGRCDACKEWNTIDQGVTLSKEVSDTPWITEGGRHDTSLKAPKLLQHIKYQAQDRIPCPDKEFSRVLGGGIVPGSLVLIGGEPGIGKSTLLLQIALTLSLDKLLYVSGEESEAQIKMRATRMGYQSENCYVLNETSLQNIFTQISQLNPSLLIIDSIQTIRTQHIESAAGSIAQIRDCTASLLRYAKDTNTPVFLIGHITKEGNLAGPKVLEHMVDTVLQFEGDRHLTYRIVRAVKNRFGATAELAIYEMFHNGLREVTNPAELLISQREQNLSGMAIGASLEGNRPLLIELQALVSPANYGNAQRSTTGFDIKRLNMLLAVLEKRAGLRLGTQDVFLNIAGGLSVADPALDLAVCVALASSLQESAITQDYCFAAEVGLGGEIRGVSRIEQRIVEADKLGFSTIFISQQNQKKLAKQNVKINIISMARINDILAALFR
ncbi:MAG: DNA repair protein RadA [Bacteroidota bacterium]